MIEITIKDRRTGQVQRFFGTTGIVLTRLDGDVTVAAAGADGEAVCDLLKEAQAHVRAEGEAEMPQGYEPH